jgi:hypothetical protein
VRAGRIAPAGLFVSGAELVELLVQVTAAAAAPADRGVRAPLVAARAEGDGGAGLVAAEPRAGFGERQIILGRAGDPKASSVLG